jgi:hypothetical protein
MNSEITGPGIGIPRKFKKRVWLHTFLLVLAGCAVSFVTKDWSWLSRFGALIVVAALFSASFNSQKAAAVRFAFLENKHGKLEPDIAQSAKKVLEDEFRADLQKLELRVGALGTLLWGFADLLNLFYQC